MIVAVNKLDTAVMAMNPSSAIYGSWNTLREPITSTWSAVKEPFVSAWDSLMGLGHQRLLARERSKLRLASCRC